jgi:large subunit ribosomal protein L29
MKLEELRNLTDEQLQHEIEESRKELFVIRRDMAVRKFKNHQRMPVVKKDIARILTILRERELVREFAGVEIAPETQTLAASTSKETPRRGRGLLGRLGGERK